MKIQQLLSSKKHASRFAEIVRILSKYGLASWLDNTKIDFIVKLLKDHQGQKLDHFTLPQKLRKACEELGPAFIKLGQILSTRPDLLGKEITTELTKLQDSTPEDRPEYVKELIETELQDTVENLFKTFEYKPIASASIGQVHVATNQNNQKLAVKILHQNIKERMTVDLNILLSLAEMGQRYIETLDRLKISLVVKDFSRTLLNELSLAKEATNIATFKSNFNDNNHIKFPEVHSEFCTNKILTMGFEEGETLNRIDLNNYSKKTRVNLANIGAEMYLDMIFRDNFYHGDPHPGNLLINQEGQLVILDFGMIGSLNSFLMDDVEEMLFSVVNKDPLAITNSLYNICEIGPEVDRKALANEIDYWLKEYISQNFNEINTAQAFEDFNRLVNNYEIVMPANLALLFKVLVQLDGTARMLNPEFNVMEVLKPYYSKIIKQRLEPKNILKKIFKHSKDWYKVAEILPQSLARNLETLNTGNLNLNLQHKGLENSVNRLVMGIIAASLFLGSVVLWSLKVPPLVYGTSVFGVLGYATAVVIIFKLIKVILKK